MKVKVGVRDLGIGLVPLLAVVIHLVLWTALAKQMVLVTAPEIHLVVWTGFEIQMVD